MVSKKKSAEKSVVYFASAKVARLDGRATLPAKFTRLLEKFDLPAWVSKKTVAIKMHVGGGIGYTTIHPLFVRRLVEAVKEAGGRPFVTDGSWSVGAAVYRGYTPETIGCPIVPAAAPMRGTSIGRRSTTGRSGAWRSVGIPPTPTVSSTSPTPRGTATAASADRVRT